MRTRLKGFSIIPVAALALAMMLPAKAASAQTAAPHAAASGSGDQAAASSKRPGDELAGKLARREVQRSADINSGSRNRAGGDVDSRGYRVRMAYASG